MKKSTVAFGVESTTSITNPIIYHTSLDWTETHQGIAHSPQKKDVHVTCPPPFCNVAHLWSPEEFFVSAVEMCLMMTFIWLAERAETPFLAYASRAEGLVKTGKEPAYFSQVTVWPRITVADHRLAVKARRLLLAAKRNCLIGNSIKTTVVVVPEIIVQGLAKTAANDNDM